MSKESTAKTHRDIILKYIREEGGLSTLDAREKLGIMSPAARVFELREDGYPIATVNTIEHDLTGAPHEVARYIMLMGELGNSHIRRKQIYRSKKKLPSEPLKQKSKKDAANLANQEKESSPIYCETNPIASELDD